MKKLMSVVSIVVLSLFMSSAFASEPPMEQPIAEEPQATQEATLEESQSVIERFAVWPFESIEKNSANLGKETIDSVKVDLSVDVDGQTYFPVQDDESD